MEPKYPSIDLLRTTHTIMTLSPDLGVVRIVRTKNPIPSAEALHTDMDACVAAFQPFRQGRYCLLLDLREAAIRSSEMYDQIIQDNMARLVAGVARMALLVNSSVGRLQSRRLLKDLPCPWESFNDEGLALAFLTQAES